MDYSIMGRTGLRVSRIGFGGAGFTNYSTVTENEGKQTVHRAIDEYGINYFDTSPSYGGIHCERILGEALESHRREDVVIATKTLRFGNDQTRNLEFDTRGCRIRAELEGQLRRLKTDYVDILQLHDVDHTDRDKVVNESLPEMIKLKQEGKIRFIGITSRSLGAIKYVLERSECIDTILTFARYNLMDTTATTYLDSFVQERNLGILNCSVIYMRALTKVAADGEFTNFWPYAGFSEEQKRVLKEASRICDAHGTDIGTLAYQFGTDSDYFHSHVISMARLRRLDQNMELYRKPYDKALAKEIYEMLSAQNYLPDNSILRRELPPRRKEN